MIRLVNQIISRWQAVECLILKNKIEMKHWLKILIGLLTLNCCNSKTEIITEKEFSQIYLDSLKKLHPEVNFQIIDNLTISSFFEGQDYKHFLDNAYREYKLQPDSIKAVISTYINSSSELYTGRQNIQPDRIVPTIKPIEYLEDLKQLSNRNEEGPWVTYEKYNDQLIIVYGEDTEKSIAYFTKEDFEKLNIARDTLQEFSISNLKKRLSEIQRIGENGSFGIAAGGVFEASLILMTSLWNKENFNVDGDFVIAIPNRDILFITGSNNVKEIEKIKNSTEKLYSEGNYSISPYLYKWNGKKFEKYNK